MDDRQLLEAAARAAGMRHMRWTGPASGMVRMLDPTRPETTGSIGPGWNPLADDGDALRLAVRLRIDLLLWINIDSVTAKTHIGAGRGISTQSGNSRPVNNHTELHGDDPAAATRRAIVRAAAALGKEAQG